MDNWSPGVSGAGVYPALGISRAKHAGRLDEARVGLLRITEFIGHKFNSALTEPLLMFHQRFSVTGNEQFCAQSWKAFVLELRSEISLKCNLKKIYFSKFH